MRIVFDPSKDEANRDKHGVSLAKAADLDILAFAPDDRRDYGEPRTRAFGVIEGEAYCLVFTVRDGLVRAISLRRAHLKEYRRYVRER
jgi:uncharacterized DUF497 family protein